MLFKNKIILLNLLGVSVIPTSFVISCGSSDWVPPKLKGFTKLIADAKFQKQIVEAKIDDWPDGDTVYFKIKDTNGKWVYKQTNGKRQSLRIASIDTPEYHDPSATDQAKRGNINDLEYLWAEKAQKWAKKELPIGTVVKIWVDGTDSFGRLVGSIFYTKDSTKPFNENYSVNIIREGLSLPRVDNLGKMVMASVKTSQLMHYLSVPLYGAYMQAKKEKKNLFSLSKSELEKAHEKHGVPGNVLPNIMLRSKVISGKKWINKESFKKYDIYN